MNNRNNNPLLCDIESGVCEMSPTNISTEESAIAVEKKPVKIIYYTDPICSSCWGIEPQLRKLKLEYGHIVEIEYRMGGLLSNWSYNSGGISKPSDVARHWDEASDYYDMPIDGDVWLEDPLNSSFPSSIAYKAAEIQDKEKAALFLREIREMVFLHKKNIAKWEHLEAAAKKVGLDEEKLKRDYETEGKDLFNDDLKLARQLGVRGFPTMFFFNENGDKEIVYGTKPYSIYQSTIIKLYKEAEKQEHDKNPKNLFNKYHSLTAKEFSELSGIPRNQAESYLQELVEKSELEKFTSKNGALWSKT